MPMSLSIPRCARSDDRLSGERREADGRNTLQFEWIVTIKEGLDSGVQTIDARMSSSPGICSGIR